MLLCILRNENDPTTKLLEKLNLNYEVVKDQFKELISENNDEYFEQLFAESKKILIISKVKSMNVGAIYLGVILLNIAALDFYLFD